MTRPPTVAVTIATKDRRAELHRTLAALAALDPAPDELLVCADGCSDDTADVVRAEFPQVRLFENERSRGSVATRDFLIRQASADLILSLDDDSYPVEADFVARLRDAAERHPEAAVLTFPQASDEYPDSLDRADWGGGHYAQSYPNSGAALRRDIYLRLAGYPGFFFHAYEEPDYALQCYAAGYAVWFEPSLTIRHHWTPAGRREQRIHARHARNEQWSAWMRCPLPYLPAVAAYRVARQLGYAAKRGGSWVLREPLWWLSAVGGLAECVRRRQPVPWPVYKAWLRLARHPLGSEAEWREAFAGTIAEPARQLSEAAR